MTRYWLFVLAAVVSCSPGLTFAQGHFLSHHSNYPREGQRSNSSQGVQPPTTNYPPFHHPGFGFGHHHHRQYMTQFLFSVYLTEPPLVTSYVPIVSTPTVMPIPMATKGDKPSSPVARFKSLDFQTKGDQKIRDQKWGEARAAYANAVRSAPDQADAHFKLAVCFAAIQRFDNAIREFKRAIKLNPNSVRTAKSLEELFGPDSPIVRSSIVGKVRVWAEEDLHSADRKFLYGAILQLNGDPKGREVLESALQLNGDDDAAHITRFLNRPIGANKGPLDDIDDQLPAFNDKPAPLAMAKPAIDLRFPTSFHLTFGQDVPVPMPDGVPRIQDRPTPLPDAPVPMP